MRAKLFKQDDGASREFKSFDPPRELAAEYTFLFGHGVILFFSLVYRWIFSPAFSESNGFGIVARVCLVFLLALDVTVLWNMAIGSYASRSTVAMLACCSGLVLIVLVGMPQSGAFGTPAGLALLINSGVSSAVFFQAIFLLWTSTYLVRIAMKDEPKK